MQSYQPPNLPGYTWRDPRTVAKKRGQYFQVGLNGLMDTSYGPTPDTLEKQISEHSQRITMAMPTMKQNTFAGEEPQMERAIQEQNDPHVLRYYAYFRESVPESPEETQRVRYVKIHVYLEDNTIMIEETHLRNSGIPQGVLLRRMRALNPNAQPYGTQYSAGDFRIGENIEIYGRVYHIYACDQYTEEYYSKAGLEVGQFEQPPDDLYSIKRKLTERPIRVTTINTDKTNLRRFLDFDGKVLRFYCSWDDRKQLFGEKRDFVLNFYLVDGSIEIRQVLPPNSGRDPVSQFLKKSFLKKPGTDELYTETDFVVGQTVNVFGRDFYIYDADQFTKNYLDEKYGPHDWTPQTVQPAVQPKRQTTQQSEFAPYNGWGDEEDSLGYCTSLHPKPPRKDYIKMIDKASDILRFTAVFVNPLPQDRSRKFVIAYYMGDDTLAVFETPQRNSGFREGKFIQRGKYKKPDGTYYQAQDLRIGEEVVINAFKFRTTGADEYALNYMEAAADQFPQSDLSEIVLSIRSMGKSAEFRKAFEDKDPELDGWIYWPEASQVLQSIGGLDEHTTTTILRRWSDEDRFDYFSFVSAI